MSFGPFAVGLGKGYTSPALASLLPNEDADQIPTFSSALPNIKITQQQGSWIASLSLLGALFGGLCSSLIIKHGRRKTLMFVSIPLSISWAFTLFAFNVEMIFASAFVAGFCSAIVQVSSYVYKDPDFYHQRGWLNWKIAQIKKIRQHQQFPKKNASCPIEWLFHLQISSFWHTWSFFHFMM